MNKLRYLDGLRGLAALIVVISHFAVAFYPALYNGDSNQTHTATGIELGISKSIFNIFYNGNFSVCIFFILSGYVLSFKYFSSKKIEVIISSAIRRYFRLLFPVLVSILLVYLCMKMSLFYNIQAGKISYSTWWLSSFWNFEANIIDALKDALYKVFFLYEWKYNTVLWTITYELYGSMLVFGSILLTRQTKFRCVVYITLLLFLYDSYYSAFVLGMILSDIMNSPITAVKKLLNNQYLVLCCFIIGLFLGSYPSGVTIENTIYEPLFLSGIDAVMFYHIIGALMIMVAVVNSKILQRFFSTRVFTFLGDISFSMYLIHVIIIGSLSSYIFINLVDLLPYSIAVGITITISLAAIFFISYMMHHFVDKKGILFSNYLFKLVSRKNQ